MRLITTLNISEILKSAFSNLKTAISEQLRTISRVCLPLNYNKPQRHVLLFVRSQALNMQSRRATQSQRFETATIWPCCEERCGGGSYWSRDILRGHVAEMVRKKGPSWKGLKVDGITLYTPAGTRSSSSTVKPDLNIPDPFREK